MAAANRMVNNAGSGGHDHWSRERKKKSYSFWRSEKSTEQGEPDKADDSSTQQQGHKDVSQKNESQKQ